MRRTFAVPRAVGCARKPDCAAKQHSPRIDPSGRCLPSPDLWRAARLAAPEPIPVVVPVFIPVDLVVLLCRVPALFILSVFIPGLATPGPAPRSPDASGAGWVCADAIAVAPNSEAIISAEMASLDRTRSLLLRINDAEGRTRERMSSGRMRWLFARKIPYCGAAPAAGNSIERDPWKG
jgi:hypothetical protein